MGGEVWCAIHPHFRPKPPVYLFPVGGPHQAAGDQACVDHPQYNGMVERTHGQLKAALRARLAGSRGPEHLPWVLLGLQTAPKEDSSVSAAELMYRAALALPAEFLSTAEPPATDFLKKLQQVEMPDPSPMLRRRPGRKQCCCRPATFMCSAAARCHPCHHCTLFLTRCWRGRTSSSG